MFGEAGGSALKGRNGADLIEIEEALGAALLPVFLNVRVKHDEFGLATTSGAILTDFLCAPMQAILPGTYPCSVIAAFSRWLVSAAIINATVRAPDHRWLKKMKPFLSLQG